MPVSWTVSLKTNKLAPENKQILQNFSASIQALRNEINRHMKTDELFSQMCERDFGNQKGQIPLMSVILRDCSYRSKQCLPSLLCTTHTVREANVINPLRGSCQGLFMYDKEIMLWVTRFSAKLITRKIKCIIRAVLWQFSLPLRF